MSQVSFAKLPKPTASQPTPQEDRGVAALPWLGLSAESAVQQLLGRDVALG